MALARVYYTPIFTALAFLTLPFLEEPPTAAPQPTFHIAPDGTVNAECSQLQPCTPQAAVDACGGGQTCTIVAADGLYQQQPIDIHHHRTITISGNCTNWDAVHFQLTKADVPQFWVQDAAIGIFRCLKISSSSTAS